jgi:8-hydroxy-5-deazaflavin:NADPH oxidoreductase
MKIGIIGSGRIGSTAGKLFAIAGHQVGLSNSRGPESLRGEVAQIGSHAEAMTVDEAARFGEVVLLAVPYRNPEALPSPEAVRGKIVIDAMNAYSGTGGMIDLGESTSSEETSRRLPGARIVKAFNTMYFETLKTGGKPGGQDRLVLFVAGDDAEAKNIVSRLIEEVGFAPVDSGSLRQGGRLQQPGSPIYNNPMTEAQAREALQKSS